jgi:hypothetical protein
MDWIGKVPADKLSWFFMLIDKLWLARNDARETKQIEDPRAIAEKAKAAVEEWAAVHVKTPSSNIRSVEHWLCPEPGWVKVNADGAFRTADSSGGSGVVLRDHHGVFICGASHFSPMLQTLKVRSSLLAVEAFFLRVSPRFRSWCLKQIAREWRPNWLRLIWIGPFMDLWWRK